MDKDMLRQMMERYQYRLEAKDYNNNLVEQVKKQGNDERIKKYMKLYEEYKERNLHGLETEESIINDIYRGFLLDLKDIKEEDTNKIYYLTRRDVHEMKCVGDILCYDCKKLDGYVKYYGNVVSASFGDIFTNLENDKYWYFIPKEYQIEFRENNNIVDSEDVSLYYLAQKYFFESAIKYGEEEAVKRVLKRKFK